MSVFGIPCTNFAEIYTATRLPDAENGSEYSRIFSHSLFHRLFQNFAKAHDTDPKLFELDFTVKGDRAYVPSGVPGIVVPLDQKQYHVVVPIKSSWFSELDYSEIDVTLKPDWLSEINKLDSTVQTAPNIEPHIRNTTLERTAYVAALAVRNTLESNHSN